MSYGELTQSDLDKIRLIVKDEVETAIHASEKRMQEYVNLKIETVNVKIDAKIDALDKKFDVKIDGMNGKFNVLLVVVISLVGLIGVAIGLPNYLSYKQQKSNNGNTK